MTQHFDMSEINRPYIRDNNYFCSICNIAIIDVNGPKTTLRSHYDRVHLIKSITFKPFVTDKMKLLIRIRKADRHYENKKYKRLENDCINILAQLLEDKINYNQLVSNNNLEMFLDVCRKRYEEQQSQQMDIKLLIDRCAFNTYDAFKYGCYGKSNCFVSLKYSKIFGAGRGIIADLNFKAGDIITIYDGKYVNYEP